MKQRAITALFFVAAMIGGIYGGRESFIILFSVISAGCFWELQEILLDKDESHRLVRKLLGTAIGLLPLLLAGAGMLYDASSATAGPGQHSDQYQAELSTRLVRMAGLQTLLFAGFLLFELFTASHKPFQNLGTLALGFFYISAPVIALFAIAMPQHQYHPNSVFSLLWLVWTNDTLAYLVGSRIGRTKLFERISPKKTWEGTLAGVIGTILMAWGLSRYYPDFNPAQWLAIGAVVSIFGTFGDLVESMLKRSAGVKDSGSLFPGHGGFLDRFDAFLFMLPFAWVAVLIFD